MKVDKKPDVLNDFFIDTKEVDIIIDDMPAFNYNSFKLEPFSRFHYSVNLYQRLDGSQYYIFKAYNNCNLYIIDCKRDFYDRLDEHITLTDDMEIWQPFNGSYQLIPLENRMNK